MSFDWTQYLTLAQELVATSTASPIEEAKLRSAISRAYYAAFCMARNHLIYKEMKTIPKGVNVHWYVVNEFEESPHVMHQRIGALLRHMKSLRNIIDYQDTFRNNLLGKTRGVLAEAAEVLRLLGTL